MRKGTPLRRRIRNATLVVGAATTAVFVSAPSVVAFTSQQVDDYQTSRPAYKQANGSWTTLSLPKKYRVNAIHAALLYTGQILIVAGSGNDANSFAAGTFRTLLYDPTTQQTTLIPTPKDLFCGGHAYLPDGNLLVAGGTRRYEVLAADVKNAAGVMTVKNENPDTGASVLPKGTRFRSPKGIEFTSTEDVTVPAAHLMTPGNHASRMAGSATVWVQAVKEGKSSIVTGGAQYSIEGSSAATAKQLYGVSDGLTMEKQEYEGLNASYIYDVQRRAYVKTGDLNYSRWYPTLVSINGGNVLAVSGLDQYGRILPGNNEEFERSANAWYDKPNLFRYFPTYPALFRMSDGDLFYSGSNSGYGPATQGRAPGIWHLTTNTFTPTPGLSDPQDNETSGSVLLPPVQGQKVMVVGGGGVGDSHETTARTSVIDLTKAGKGAAAWTAGPSLPHPTRYPGVVSLPDDSVLITGGSSDYRGQSNSDLHQSVLYTPATNTMRSVAPNRVGRDYHSEALLLPDGRVMTLGSNPLFSDADNKIPGQFEQRIEIYSPPYLYNGDKRPTITGGPAVVQRGTTNRFTTPDADRVMTARLIRPSAVTHTTDVEQRSVALDVTRRAGAVDLSVPVKEGLVPSGWYMLFLMDAQGTPSIATWVQVR